MSGRGRFFLPGPTEVHPDVLAAMARPMIGHRGPEMEALLGRAQPGLRRLFGTDRPVVTSTGSATGMMEAAVRGGVARRALCLVNGAFSQRFAEIVTGCGREMEVYRVEEGAVHDPAEVERRLRSGGFDALTVVHSETSTGALNPLPDICRAVGDAERATGKEILRLVDGVTSVGGAPVRADDWGLDFVLTGSQKAMALPPGLSFAVASERFLARAEGLEGRGYYLDPVRLVRAAESGRTTTTPAISLFYALEAQLERILREGVEARFARHRAMADRTARWAASASSTGGGILAAEGSRSPTVSVVMLDEGITGPEVVRRAGARGFTLAPGYGNLKENAFRIGHMGDHTMEELDALLDTLDEVLR